VVQNILKSLDTAPVFTGVTRRYDDLPSFNTEIQRSRSRIQKELGFVPQYDLKAGWEETIREMRGKASAED
jgi:nucleoside-diphosphate-sugar epimerase